MAVKRKSLAACEYIMGCAYVCICTHVCVCLLHLTLTQAIVCYANELPPLDGWDGNAAGAMFFAFLFPNNDEYMDVIRALQTYRLQYILCCF